MSKKKRVLNILKWATAVFIIVSALVISSTAVIVESYLSGQLSACQVVLKGNPYTRTMGFYCEREAFNIYIKSKLLRSAIHNVTQDKAVPFRAR